MPHIAIQLPIAVIPDYQMWYNICLSERLVLVCAAHICDPDCWGKHCVDRLRSRLFTPVDPHVAALPCTVTVTSQWARWRLKSLTSRMFARVFVQAEIKWNIRDPRHWPLNSTNFIHILQGYLLVAGQPYVCHSIVEILGVTTQWFRRSVNMAV